MKNLFLSIFGLFLFSFSVNAQSSSIFVPGHPVGANTFITTPIFGNTGYSPTTGQPIYLNGFEMKIGAYYSPFAPLDFYPSSVLYQNNWIYSIFVNNPILKVAAVGNPVQLYNDELGTLRLFVGESSGMHNLSEINFFDGTSHWIVGSSSFNIISLPQYKYTDHNKNNVIDIGDAIIEWGLVGAMIGNDTLIVLSDPSGDGKIATWDVSLILQKVVDPSFVYPIFCNYGYGLGKAITLTWKLLANGKWGLFSNEKITNGDLVGTGPIQNGSTGWLKKVNNKVYFINQNSWISDPILIADHPVSLTGTVNEGRQIIVSTSLTGVEKEEQIPSEFVLKQNYPNPFNPSTTISYQLPTSGHVTLKVYDMLGKEVATLVNEEKPTGIYETKFNATGLSSGTYIYRLSCGSFIQNKKMILMK